MSGQAKIIKIKDAVRRNFDESPDHYQRFEDEFGFFRNLNEKLLSGMSFRIAPDILDVGCGTGAACSQILEEIPSARVWGLDNSRAMLDAATERFKGDERMHFVEGDAAHLQELFTFAFDAIIYSASIFLIPDYHESLRQSKFLLKEHGMLGLSFMDGVFDESGNNILQMADLKAKQHLSLRKPVDLMELETFFSSLFPRHRTWRETFVVPKEQLLQFFSIPAMSAGLFPGVAYLERLEKLRKVFSFLSVDKGHFRWAFMVGEN